MPPYWQPPSPNSRACQWLVSRSAKPSAHRS
jgi:hypothetical protein